MNIFVFEVRVSTTKCEKFQCRIAGLFIHLRSRGSIRKRREEKLSRSAAFSKLSNVMPNLWAPNISLNDFKSTSLPSWLATPTRILRCMSAESLEGCVERISGSPGHVRVATNLRTTVFLPSQHYFLYISIARGWRFGSKEA